MMITSYIKDETASSVETVVLTVVGIIVDLGVGWWIYNGIHRQTKTSSCSNSSSPFCME